jgi:hypothetical protein
MRIITEIDLSNGCKHTRYFRFPLDGGKEFCYRSRTSYNAFFNGMKKRNYTKPRHYLYAGKDEEEFEINKRMRLIENPEFIDVSSIWEFYKLIGFDYKNNKWIKENEV